MGAKNTKGAKENPRNPAKSGNSFSPLVKKAEEEEVEAERIEPFEYPSSPSFLVSIVPFEVCLEEKPSIFLSCDHRTLLREREKKLLALDERGDGKGRREEEEEEKEEKEEKEEGVERFEVEKSINEDCRVFFSLLIQYLKEQNSLSSIHLFPTLEKEEEEEEEDKQIDFKVEGEKAIGTVIRFCVTNRPPLVFVFISPLFSLPISLPPLFFGLMPSSSSVFPDLISYKNYCQQMMGSHEEYLKSLQEAEILSPSEKIRTFHFHCHFGKQNIARALGLQNDMADFLSSHGATITNKRVYQVKNGPHVPWNWEIHVNEPEAIGLALLYFVTHAQEGGKEGDIFFCFHSRTEDWDDVRNEYMDHLLRMTWVGRLDSVSLDLDFFKRW